MNSDNGEDVHRKNNCLAKAVILWAGSSYMKRKGSVSMLVDNGGSWLALSLRNDRLHSYLPGWLPPSVDQT